MKNACLIFICLLSLVSCSEDVFIVSEPQLIVEGWIDDGGFPVVILSESVPVSDKYADVNSLKDNVVKWAKVTVSDGDNEVVLTGKANSSYFPPYIYTTSRMRGVSGKKYKLTVTFEDYHVEAETQIPEKGCVERFIKETINGKYSLKALINDNPDEKNYYKFFVRMMERDSMFLSSNLAVIDDSEFDFPLSVPLGLGKSILHDDELEDYQLNGSERLLVKFAQIDSVAYNFWNEYKNYVELGQSFIFRYSKNAYSNISGGLGFWFGYGSTTYLCEPFNHDNPIVVDR